MMLKHWIYKQANYETDVIIKCLQCEKWIAKKWIRPKGHFMSQTRWGP